MGVFNYSEPTSGINLFANAIQQMHSRNAERTKNTLGGVKDLITGGVNAYTFQKRKDEMDLDQTGRVNDIDTRLVEIDNRIAAIDAELDGMKWESDLMGDDSDVELKTGSEIWPAVETARNAGNPNRTLDEVNTVRHGANMDGYTTAPVLPDAYGVDNDYFRKYKLGGI